MEAAGSNNHGRCLGAETPRPQVNAVARVAVLAGGVHGARGARARSGERRCALLDQPPGDRGGRARIEHLTDEARFSVTFEETARDAGEVSARAADRARLATAAMRTRRDVCLVSAISDQPGND